MSVASDVHGRNPYVNNMMSRLKEIITHKSFRVSFLITLLYCGINMGLLHFGLIDYGWIVFFVFPFSLGLALGQMLFKHWALAGFVSAFLITIILILTSALEGIICILFSLPIVIPMISIGIITRRYLTEKGIIRSRDDVHSFLFPLLLAWVGIPFEWILSPSAPSLEKTVTERFYPNTPLEVYHAIKSVDTLIGPKPFLMRLDLPIPEKCILEREEVGALRTCYFSGGTITERVTEIEPGRILRMDVIDYQLTGRKWLGFIEAVYLFDPMAGDSCLLRRITTYSSGLKPRWYWRHLENVGIQQEHQYVLDDLETRLRDN